MSERREYGGWLELESAALRHNLEAARRLSTPADVMPVVKANAYGAGAVGLARTLEQAGVGRFAVATVDEGAELREAGVRASIVCLTYFDAADGNAIHELDLTPTVYSDDGVGILRDLAGRTGKPVRVWVKVDTGLGRLGVALEDAPRFIEGILAPGGLQVDGVYSTLGEARERDRRQLERFVALRSRLAPRTHAVWSIASSHGILTLPDACLDVVRPGIMLLGFPPSEPERMDSARMALADLRPVVTWKTRVAAVKTVSAGEQVGYGERDAFPGDTRVASLMIGWADGFAASEEFRGRVLLGGRPCPVLALSANTTLVDVTAVPLVTPGDEAVLLGRQGDAEIDADELARSGGGVYRMLARIPARVPRIWS